MNRSTSLRIAAGLLATGLLLSACGQSDASGRIRNSAPEGECYETQEMKDSEVAFYQSRADEARRLGELREELKKQQDETSAAYNSMLPKDGETWASLSAKVDRNSQVAVDEWDAMMEAVLQANIAASEAAGKYAAANNEYRDLPQYNHYLAVATGKPVCETNIPVAPNSDNSEPETSTPENSQPENVEPDTTVSEASSSEAPTDAPTDQTKDECLNPPDIPTGTDYTLRQGEEMTVEIPLCPEWGESAGIVIGADSAVNSRVVTTFPPTNGTKTAFIRITGTNLFTTSFWVYQVKQSFPYAESEKRYFSVTVVPVETVDPCADKTPEVSMNSDGILTARKDCKAATHVEMIVSDVETKEIRAHFHVLMRGDTYKTPVVRNYFGTRRYVIESSYLLRLSDGASESRVGLTNWIEFQFDNPSIEQNQPTDPLGIAELPPVLSVEPEPQPDSESEPQSDAQASDDDKPAVSPAFVVVEPRTTSITCDQACTDNVVQQSGIEPEKVKAVEVSVDGSVWESLTPNLLLPLTTEETTIQLRVTPTESERPVVLSTTVYKNAAAINESTESQTLIVSGSGTQSVEVVEDDDSSSSTTLIILIVAILAGLLVVAVAVLPRVRRKTKTS